MSAHDIFDLTGRIALVTGASRGIGQAIAVAFAERGAHVLAVARGREGLDETAQRAGGLRGTIETYIADLAESTAPDAVVAQVVEVFGGLDVLVNNAGAFHSAPIEESTLEQWDAIHDVGLRSAFLLCRAASPQLEASEHGKVINMSSVVAQIGVSGNAVYAPAKIGLVALTRTLAVEWGARNVQVNAIAPGFVATEMMAHVLENERTAKWIRRTVPLQRWATVDDIVGPAVFLASSASDFMTGQTMLVDGGQSTV